MKFCQNWVSNSRDIADIEFVVVVVVGGGGGVPSHFVSNPTLGHVRSRVRVRIYYVRGQTNITSRNRILKQVSINLFIH